MSSGLLNFLQGNFGTGISSELCTDEGATTGENITGDKSLEDEAPAPGSMDLPLSLAKMVVAACPEEVSEVKS